MKKIYPALVISLFSCAFSHAQFQLVGSATQTVNPSCYILTPDQDGQSGAVWYTQSVDISKAFEIYGQIYLGTNNNQGADGMAFVLQQVSANVGSSGGGLGYQGLSPSLALEFDTHRNQENSDPNFDHMALMTNGVPIHNSPNDLTGTTAILDGLFGSANAEDGRFHNLRIKWNPQTQEFLAFVDCDLRIRYFGDIINEVFNGNSNVFWGFTASTGSSSNQHSFCLDYVSFIEELRDTTLCQGQSVQLNAGVGAGNSFSWFPAAGLSNANIPNPIANPTVTTTYVLTVTDICGSTRTDSVTISVQPPLQANAGADVATCFNEPAQLSASGGLSYSWAPSTALSDPNIANPTATPPITTVYTVRVSDGFGCSDTDEVRVTVNPLPTVDAGADTQVCEGLSVDLQASGGLQYQWTPTAGLSSATVANPTATPTSTTLYTVEATDANGCKNTASVNVQVNPLPNISAGNDQSLCIGGELTLSASGGNTYSWTPAQGLSNTSIANPVASPTVSSTYTLTGTDANGCQNTDEITITVNPLPMANAGADATICEGDMTPLQASGGNQYSWNPSIGLSNSTIANPIASPQNTTTYTVFVTDANGCSNTDEVEVVVNPRPLIVASTDLAVVCQGGSTELSASGGLSYVWSPAASLDNPNAANPIASPEVSTQYTLNGTDANGCMDTAQITIVVNPLPNISAGSDVSICEGSDIALQASGGVDYIWSPTSGLSDPTSANPTASPASSTQYNLTGTDANGCMNTASVMVAVNTKPVAQGLTNYEVCLGDGASLQVSGGTSYRWSTGEVSNSIVVAPSQTTSYWVIPESGGCEGDTLYIQVAINEELPLLAAEISETSGFAPLTVNFNNLSQSAVSYLWDFGDGGTSEAISPSYTYQQAGIYSVRLSGQNAAGCEAFIDLGTIEVFEPAQVIPNVFTPNGDGINDTYIIQLGTLERFHLIIYSRWGKLMFETTDPNEHWDGIFNGKPSPEGVYTFRMEAAQIGGQEIMKMGTITLLR